MSENPDSASDVEVNLDALVRPFVDEYEFRADEGNHTPSDAERALIEDALHGFIAEHCSAQRSKP